MKTTYGESGEGQDFVPPDRLFPDPRLVNFIVRYGQEGLDALPDAEDEQVQELIEQMVQAGLLERDGEGQLRLTPRMVTGMQHRALLEIFRSLQTGTREGHAADTPGRSGERSDGTHGYVFGDPLSELDLHGTLRNAIRRTAPKRTSTGERSAGMALDEQDFEVFNVEGQTDTALCLLIDLSGSMARYGRHIAAKRVAMGLRALMRARFPSDTVDFIGFASTAQRLSERDLPLVMPKPITSREWDIRVRVPLDQAEMTHPHFTNLHHALQMARAVLARRGAANKQIFIVTDGQPTAHLTGQSGAQILNLIYPPSPASAQATLAESLRCRRAGIRIASFALIEEYEGLDWVGFVEQMTRLTRGVAFYCAAGDLGGMLVDSYLAGKRKRTTAK